MSLLVNRHHPVTLAAVLCNTAVVLSYYISGGRSHRQAVATTNLSPTTPPGVPTPGWLALRGYSPTPSAYFGCLDYGYDLTSAGFGRLPSRPSSIQPGGAALLGTQAGAGNKITGLSQLPPPIGLVVGSRDWCRPGKGTTITTTATTSATRPEG